ncbi:hypothetical protein SAMN04488527_13028 [Aliiroseovarius crassostreae]|uniref:hypothetical protein n=1 Tax=Aliiroseovarius crassostreae TaxID=154981 RepID=UPI0008E1CE39|nr:hypothetical protein [Aliiroseovarius crassostreae]SFU89615.1 hypothetical protein SAMN04488527_13028 [Aliiroseovarius crassostreae]
MTAAGRPPSSQTSWIKVQEFRFDPNDSNDKSLAVFLRQAPKRGVRSRMKELMVIGYRQHLLAVEKEVGEYDEPKGRNKIGVIGKFSFDRTDPIERDLYEYLKRTKNRRMMVKDRMQTFIRDGFAARHSTKKPTQQTDEVKS